MTLYLFDHGEYTTFTRRPDGTVFCAYREDLPENFYDYDGGLVVFEGIVHRDTAGASEEALEARGLPYNAANYDEWWEGKMRPATDAEILAVFSNTPTERTDAK